MVTNKVKRTKPNIILITVLSLVMPFLVVEMLIRLFDPLSTLDFHARRAELATVIEHPTRHYSMPERIVPDSDADGCEIAFIGDSVTYGWGVDERSTFVNILASTYGLHARNLGIAGYNADVIATVAEETSGLKVWLVVHNDAIPTPTAHDLQLAGQQSQGWLQWYYPKSWLAATHRGAALLTPDFEGNDLELFWQSVARIQETDTIIVTLTDPFGDYVHSIINTVHIPYFTQGISVSDPNHPNETGHQEIAFYLSDTIEHLCD